MADSTTLDSRRIPRHLLLRDANNFAVGYVYFEQEPGRRAAANLMSKDEARKIANGIAKLAELLDAHQKAEPD
jgi:hypothetical protein